MEVKGGSEGLLTPDEVAERCRVTRRTVYEWLREGKLQGNRGGRKWLVRPEEVARFLGLVPDVKPSSVAGAEATPAVAVESDGAEGLKRNVTLPGQRPQASKKRSRR